MNEPRIKLIDLIKSSGVEISDYKIHCAIDEGHNEARSSDE